MLKFLNASLTLDVINYLAMLWRETDLLTEFINLNGQLCDVLILIRKQYSLVAVGSQSDWSPTEIKLILASKSLDDYVIVYECGSRIKPQWGTNFNIWSIDNISLWSQLVKPRKRLLRSCDCVWWPLRDSKSLFQSHWVRRIRMLLTWLEQISK